MQQRLKAKPPGGVRYALGVSAAQGLRWVDTRPHDDTQIQR